MKPQSRAVLTLLREHPEGISQQTAIRAIACYRLAARVADLRADGFDVRSQMLSDGHSRFALYRLVENEQMVVGL